jgi:flotillin
LRSKAISSSNSPNNWSKLLMLTTVAVGGAALYSLSQTRSQKLACASKPTLLELEKQLEAEKQQQRQSIEASLPAQKGFLTKFMLGATPFIIVGLAFAAYAVTRFRRCPANQILVIQGKVFGEKGKSARCMHGGGTFVWPIIQDYAYMSLEPIQIEVPLKSALSAENIRVNVPSVFTIAIGTTEDLMQNAAQRLLGLTPQEVSRQAQDIIFGQLREVIASMRIEEINRSREKFVLAVTNNIEAELAKIGLMLINVNITDLTDESDYLASIGRKAAQEAVQKANVDVAEQQKIGAIGVAGNQKEAALRIAELRKEQNIGEAVAKFQQETEIANQDREKRIKIAGYNSTAIHGENEAAILIANSNAQLQIKKAEAYRESESKKKEAEAYVREAQYRAEAKTALAEAERVEAEKRAELVSPATAQKAKLIVEAEAEAERLRIDAKAQAEAIFLKLDAEARGQFQLLEKKAQGMRLMVEAAGGSQQAFQMLMLEHIDHLAETGAKAISNIKFDKIVVWDGGNANANLNGAAGGGSGGGGGANATANFIRGVASALPPAMHMMRDIAGVDLPKYFGTINVESEKEEEKEKEKEK